MKKLGKSYYVAFFPNFVLITPFLSSYQVISFEKTEKSVLDFRKVTEQKVK